MSVQRSNPFRNRRASLGFTLVELLVVVVIIGISAALTMPMVLGQMRQRKLRETAQAIASIYSSARMRALARGSAVLVRYSPAGFSVVESIDGAAVAAAHNSPACGDEPGLGCLTNTWADPTTSRQVASFTLHPELTLAGTDAVGNATPTLNVCFTPMGRSFTSTVANAPLVPMAGTPVFTLTRSKGGKWDGGYGYYVAVLPNGVARMTRGEVIP